MRLFCLLLVNYVLVISTSGRYLSNELDYLSKLINERRQSQFYKRDFDVDERFHDGERDYNSKRNNFLNLLSDVVEFNKKKYNVELAQEKQSTSSSVQTHKFLMPGVAPQLVRNLHFSLMIRK